MLWQGCGHAASLPVAPCRAAARPAPEKRSVTLCKPITRGEQLPLMFQSTTGWLRFERGLWRHLVHPPAQAGPLEHRAQDHVQAACEHLQGESSTIYLGNLGQGSFSVQTASRSASTGRRCISKGILCLCASCLLAGGCRSSPKLTFLLFFFLLVSIVFIFLEVVGSENCI